jgi:hypothetical protein
MGSRAQSLYAAQYGRGTAIPCTAASCGLTAVTPGTRPFVNLKIRNNRRVPQLMGRTRA